MANEPEAPEESSSEEPRFRRVDARSAEAILPALLSAFDRWPPVEIDVPPLDHLRWKMSPPPPLPSDQHAIVEIDGAVAAVQLRWPSRAHVFGEDVPSEVGGDLAVHESFRGRGLSRMIRAEEWARVRGQRLAGYDTRPRNELVRYMQQSDGTKVSRLLEVWRRSFTLRGFVGDHRVGGAPHLVQTSARWLIGAFTRHGRGRGGTAGARIESIGAFDERADELWDRVRAEYVLARRRDHAWLNWRYLDRRAGLISAFGTFEGEQLQGYVVVRRSHGEGHVLDLVTTPTEPGVGAALLEHAMRELRAAGCRGVTCLLPAGHRESAALGAAGFFKTGAGRTLDFNRERHDGLPEILEIAEDPTAPIHVMPGEFDHA